MGTDPVSIRDHLYEIFRYTSNVITLQVIMHEGSMSGVNERYWCVGQAFACNHWRLYTIAYIKQKKMLLDSFEVFAFL